MLNKNGGLSDNGVQYEGTLADNWMIAAVTSEENSQTDIDITVLSYTAPSFTTVNYNYDTAKLSIIGTNFVSKYLGSNDVDVSLCEVTGELGDSFKYILTSVPDVDIVSETLIEITFTGVEKLLVNSRFNQDGTSSDDGTVYGLTCAEDWLVQAAPSATVALSNKAVTVSSYIIPAITASTGVVYDYQSDSFTVTGTRFVKDIMTGLARSDVDVSKFIITGEMIDTVAGTYTLTTDGVDVTDETSFTINLNALDKLYVNGLLNMDGKQADDGATNYNFNAQEDWMRGTDTDANIVSASNDIDVSNYQKPIISSATYNPTTGVLVVTGDFFVHVNGGATNDVDVSMIEITGECPGNTYPISSGIPPVAVSGITQFSVTFFGDDLLYVNGLLNKDGFLSDDGTTYNIKVNDDWMVAGPTGVDITDAVATIEVSGYTTPTITGADYDYSAGTLTVHGTNFAKIDGSNNDVDVKQV